MRIARCRVDGAVRVGVVEGDRVDLLDSGADVVELPDEIVARVVERRRAEIDG